MMARTVRLLHVSESAEHFVALLEAAKRQGMRLGWLEVGALPATPLDEVASRGAARAVALDGTGSVAVKRTAGPPVLRDVVREHFLGCAAVLVRTGETPPAFLAEMGEGAASLRCAGESFLLARAGEEREVTRDALIEALSRPSFWAWRSSAT